MDKNSLTQQTLSGFFWHSGVAGTNFVIRALVLILLARYLTAYDFGVVAAAMMVALLTQAITESGVGKALVQRPTLTEQHFRSGFAISFYISLGAATLLLLAAPLLAAAVGITAVEPIVRFFSLLLLLNGIAAVPMAMLQRQRRFRLSSIIELTAFAIGYGGVGLLLTFAGLGVWALATAQVMQGLLRTILYLLAARPPVSFLARWAAAKDLYRTSSGYSFGKIGNLVATQVDYFIVGRLLGAEALGLYSRAYQFLMLPAQLVGTASQTVLFPSIASIQDQPERVARGFVRVLGVIAMITLPLSAVLMVLAPELVVVTLGSHWAEMVAPFQILIATLIFRTSYKISDSLALALGAMYPRALRQWVYAGAVAGGALAGAHWGLAGVAVGVGAAVVVNFLMMTQLALRLTGVSASQIVWVHIRHVLAALPVLVTVALAVGFARSEELGDPAVLAVGSTTAAASFMLMWWRCRWIFGEDGKWAHSMAVSRLPRRRSGT